MFLFATLLVVNIPLPNHQVEDIINLYMNDIKINGNRIKVKRNNSGRKNVNIKFDFYSSKNPICSDIKFDLVQGVYPNRAIEFKNKAFKVLKTEKGYIAEGDLDFNLVITNRENSFLRIKLMIHCEKSKQVLYGRDYELLFE